jgi:hypothetical protein
MLSAFGLPTSPIQSAFYGAAPSTNEWEWVTEQPKQFLSQLEIQYVPPRMTHQNPRFASFYLSEETIETRRATPPILMTESVWSGYRHAEPNSGAVTKSLFKKIKLNTPGYAGDVYGGDAIFPALKE